MLLLLFEEETVIRKQMTCQPDCLRGSDFTLESTRIFLRLPHTTKYHHTVSISRLDESGPRMASLFQARRRPKRVARDEPESAQNDDDGKSFATGLSTQL